MPNLRSKFLLEVRFSEPRVFFSSGVRHYRNKCPIGSRSSEVTGTSSYPFKSTDRSDSSTVKKTKRGVSSRFFSFMLAAWNIEQRWLLTNALYRTVATSQIPEKEFLCMRQRADLKCRSGKSSYQCIAHTSTVRGVLRFVPCISRPIAWRDGGRNRDS